jgi:hypothetical protein
MVGYFSMNITTNFLFERKARGGKAKRKKMRRRAGTKGNDIDLLI